MPFHMTRVGNALVIAGAVIGGATVLGVVMGAEITLSPEMVQALVYKGLGAVAFGLIVVGSWVARSGREQERKNKGVEASAPELGAGDALPLGKSNAPQPVHDRVNVHRE